MTKIPIITQNFSSPDVVSDTPFMLLPQAPSPQLPDKDQEGFSQLLLRDLHRHRQSYVRSYTAFETLKKRQDFILRQENLRALQNLEQRIATKQDQFIDQSIHSYEQCFVKVINGNLTTNGNPHEQQKRPKTAAPSFDKFHIHQLSHISSALLDSPPKIPFHRYQQSHRPPLPPKYRSHTIINHSAQSLHDAFQSSSFSNHNQPFLTFTESYLQKYGDRSPNKFHTIINNDEMNEIQEKQEEEEGQQRQIESASVEPNLMINQNKKSKTPDLQRIRASASSRNTNTPSSTPQMGYNDAVRDGLTTIKDNNDSSKKTSLNHEKRRSSQQSTSQISNTSSKNSTKRPKTAKKKQVVVNLISDKKLEPLSSKTIDNDLLKTAMIVQNYDNNTTNEDPPLKIERPQSPPNIIRKTPSVLRRSSIKSNDSNKQSPDNINTRMTPTEPKVQPIIDNTKEEIVVPITNDLTEIKQDTNDQLIQALEVADNRKRVKKGAFDVGESMNDLIAFELGMMGSNRGAMRKNEFRLGKENTQNQNGNQTELIPGNQGTLDLLEKIRQSATGLPIGRPPVSQQGCRFELPYDLKLLESLTPLEYLSKYCRLSSRRHYQFKRLFDKYRNKEYRFESNNLYTSILDIHTESFTRTQYDSLCQIINIGNEQYQFKFETFAGILALCERILYDASKFRGDFDDQDLTKDTIEKCDFDSLDRKLDGLIISDVTKRLLKLI